MAVWAEFYEKLFNFREIRYFDIEGKQTGLFSKAMTSPCGKIRIPLNESQDDKSQIEEFLREYKGEGIQHIALGTSDIYDAVDILRARGVAFQDTPDTYYEMLPERIQGHDENIPELKKRGVLMDGAPTEGQGLLLQIFTQNVIGPIFFEIIQRKGDPVVVDTDEHPRATSMEALAKLRPIVRADGTVTAGNASGVNDGSAALIIASEEAAQRNGLTPKARILGAAVAGVPPRIMGIGPAPASEKLMKRLGLRITDFDVIELNEAFAAQGLAVLRQLGLPDDAPQVNPNGGAIALGHPLGMSGARLALTATEQLQRTGGKLALATMCIGVGQGIALALERV
jgi:catechol 2,3-dioxygenase-like lactoylglutathione lyase family enzyme